MTSSGKWALVNVPHKGWECINIEDLGDPSAICGMCETTEIRYVHYMQHPDYAGILEVGCVCAEHMSGDYIRPKQREAALRNAAARRRKWLTRTWRISQRGNQFLNTDGYNVVIFERSGFPAYWTFNITDRQTDRIEISSRRFQTSDAAKLGAFDGLIFLKEKYG
jgi:hypothetical protein